MTDKEETNETAVAETTENDSPTEAGVVEATEAAAQEPVEVVAEESAPSAEGTAEPEDGAAAQDQSAPVPADPEEAPSEEVAAAEPASPEPAAPVTDKGPLKAKLKELKARRDEALESGDSAGLKRVRAKIRRQKRRLRKAG